MELKAEKKKDTLYVQITGELDLHTATDFSQGLDKYLQKYPSIKNLILDLKGIDFIDSSGLGVILSKYKLISKKGGQIALVGVSPQVKRIFEVSGMLKIMSIYNSKEKAVAAL